MNADNRPISVAVNRSSADDGARVEAAADEGTEARPKFTPLIDIHEESDGLILEADLPGVSESDIHIQLEDNVLTLHARIASGAPEGARMVHQEYRVGDFARSFILSDEVERGQIAAELKNGVLRLTLPKAERVKTRRIEIKS